MRMHLSNTGTAIQVMATTAARLAFAVIRDTLADAVTGRNSGNRKGQLLGSFWINPLRNDNFSNHGCKRNP